VQVKHRADKCLGLQAFVPWEAQYKAGRCIAFNLI
jgi:hypothetical protein